MIVLYISLSIRDFRKYRNSMELIVAERSQQAKRAKEHSQALEQNRREKKELAEQPKIKTPGTAEKKRF